jgi:quercetin dioxygenase-like cupin family protein
MARRFRFCAENRWKEASRRKTMALTMLEKTSDRADKSTWPPALIAEFEREHASNNPCVGNMLVSESERVRVWMIKLAPGERFGFHRHVLDYFWTCVTGGRGRQHVHDGTTVEYSYAPGETRHETYGRGEFKVHDLENIGDKEMVFMTIEFLNSANQPLVLPDRVRAAA